MLCRGKVESTQPQEEKHEEDDGQDYRGYVFAASVRHGSGFGRHGASTSMLAQPLLITIGFVRREWLV